MSSTVNGRSSFPLAHANSSVSGCPSSHGLDKLLRVTAAMADVVTVPSHLKIPDVTTYMAATAAGELSTLSERQEPETFEVDVAVHLGTAERRLTVAGRDIYAFSAPLAVEAVERLLTGRFHVTGVASAGAMFDAPDFLHALSEHITPAAQA